MSIDICIFYSEPDKDKVAALDSILTDFGWNVWWDKKGVKYGSWQHKIENKLKETKSVIVIWNSHAIREESVTVSEALMAQSYHKPMVTLLSEEKIIPVIPFNKEHITANIDNWNESPETECIENIVDALETILGLAPKKWRGERPNSINIFGNTVKLPCFVKSLSSFETQINPVEGIGILDSYPNIDALLVSAYDLYADEKRDKKDYKVKREAIEYINDKLKKLSDEGTFILLDSGNYEASRYGDDSWSKDKFEKVLSFASFTFAFCFDNLNPDINNKANVDDILSRLEGEFENKLLPIIHAPKNNEEKPMYEKLPELFYELAKSKKIPIIAVPERELGDGITQKVRTVSDIRSTLNKLGYYQPIHILGTGNPLSIAILAAAGADFFDGLEWCRTVTDRDTGFLFHHQQFDFFISQSMNPEQEPLTFIRELMNDSEVEYHLKMALHNLAFFKDWMDELQISIANQSIAAMLSFRANFAGQSFLKELKKGFPGLFA